MTQACLNFAIYLHLILLTLQCAAVGSARFAQSGGCHFDRLMKGSGPLPVAVVRETPKQHSSSAWQTHAAEEASNKWQPLRIKASITNFDVNKFKCSDSSDIAKVENVFGESVPCILAKYLLSTVFTKAIISRILHFANKLHTDRLLVHPVNGEIAVQLANDGMCKSFATGSVTLKNADMLLYATASPLIFQHMLSVAVPCALHADGRPAIGAIAFNPTKSADIRIGARYAAHEIAHALGFSYENMKQKNMIEEMKQTNGASANTVFIVKSEKVKNFAIKQYNCPQIAGMQLENEDLPASNGNEENGVAEFSSHWERRHAKDDLMAFPFNNENEPFFGYYTEITLSLFEDLGFYKAKIEMAEPMAWGKNKGCGFLHYNCKSDPEFKMFTMFCDQNNRIDACTSNRLGIGKCQSGNVDKKEKTKTPSSSLQSAFRAIALHGANELEESAAGEGSVAKTDAGSAVDKYMMDYCPVVVGEMLCRVPVARNPVYDINAYGPMSQCVNAVNLKKRGEDNIYTALCAEIRCEDNNVVMMKYGNLSDFVSCPSKKGKKGALNVSSLVFESGTILCPKYDEVCGSVAHGKGLTTEQLPGHQYLPGKTENKKSGVNKQSASTTLCFVLAATAALLLYF